MPHVLCIGNSFSQDATHYLHQIAAADSAELHVCNLVIGGCSLERHWINTAADLSSYRLEENGESTGRYISVPDALGLQKWDYVTVQQASHDSGIADTYHPYLEKLAAYIREKAPSAQILLHQTWAYDVDSQHGEFIRYKRDQNYMYECICAAYNEAAQTIGARIIPSGDAVQRLRTREPFLYGHGGMSVCRDGFHMNLIYGRYLLSALWYKVLTGNSVKNNTYIPRTPLAPNAVCDEKVLQVVKDFVDELQV